MSSSNSSAPQAAASGASEGDPEARGIPRDEVPARVPGRQRLAYSLGHVLNDLCASMWFTYLLLFFHKVIKFDNFLSGIIMLVGQIADGLSTLFVGYFSDKDNCLSVCDKYGKRKSWHALGTFCVLISFPFIFVHCLGCASAPAATQAAYYAAFVVVFQFGWASTQISHLSIIPDLTSVTSERGALTSLRYGATVVSNVTVYLVAWAFLGAAQNPDTMVGPEDAPSFRNTMIVVVCVGVVASVCFHLFVKVPRTDAESRQSSGGGNFNRADRRMRPIDWFKEPQFYQVAGVYMTTRLFVNLSQGYVPIYLQVTLQLPGTSVAVIPLVTFGCGFLTSLVTERIMPRIGIFGTLFMGAAVAVGACTWIQLGSVSSHNFKHYEIYAIAAMVGTGGSMLLIASLTLTAGLIGPNTESGAFVYGSMSLSDKFSNGLAFVLIQNYIPTDIDTCIECRLYFRTVLFAVCGGAALMAAACAATMLPFRLGERWVERRARRAAAAYEEIPGGVQDDREIARTEEEEEDTERTPLVT